MSNSIPISKFFRDQYESLNKHTLLITDLNAIPSIYFEDGTVNILRNKIKRDILLGVVVPGCKLIRKGKS